MTTACKQCKFHQVSRVGEHECRAADASTLPTKFNFLSGMSYIVWPRCSDVNYGNCNYFSPARLRPKSERIA